MIALLKRKPEYVIAPVLLVALLLCWEFGVRIFDVPNYVLPTPSDMIRALIRGLNAGVTDKGGYWLHMGVTLYEVLLGFVVGSTVGLFLGMIISQFRIVEATLQIYLIAFQSLPKVALAPLFITWFGFGVTSKVVIISTITFFPLLVNSIAGFRSVDADQIDLMRSLKAGRWQIFWKVRFPSALTYIFAGLNMAGVFAVIGAVVGEFVGAQAGLGTLILAMNAQFDTAGTFSVLLILAAIGVALHYLTTVTERRVVFWAGDAEHH